MAEDMKRTTKKAASLRSASHYSDSTGRSANKSRSLREETYKPADPNKPGPQTIYLNSDYITYRNKPEPEPKAAEEPVNTEPADIPETAEPVGESEPKETSAVSSFLSRFRDKFAQASGQEDSESGSTYKRKQAQQAARNDLLKKGIIGLIALIIIILAIILIARSCQVKDVGEITINSTATTQTLDWSGARKGLSYEVYRAEGGNGQYKLIDTLTEGENSRTYDNLTAGTLYKYNIVTVKGNGTKTEGTMAQGYTKPNAVTGTSASTTETENSLTVNWALQGNTATYELKYGLYDNLRDATTVYFTANDAAYNSDAGTYSYTINNLVNGETYYLSLRTVCEDSASEWCATFSGEVTDPISQTAAADDDQKMVALTFDGGPDGGTVTDRILNVLAENDSKATFFQTGLNAEYYPDMMSRIVSEGHEIGNHTYDESHVGEEVTEEDILNANASIEAACGQAPVLFRATRGEVTDNIREICEAAGMPIILFNFDSHDWEYYDYNEIVERIETYVEDGDIIQFRNVYDETAEAIEVLVPYLIEEGYQLVTLSDLIEAKTGEAPQVGVVYNSAYDYE
ncbi:MAG: polysaccharide deacetylase family protein [Parasporobacterium sp.]|nr:polysaccharide deacetylase family protein [Parasporobacterium sp.]